MIIRFLGHAAFALEHDGKTVLVDPLLDPRERPIGGREQRVDFPAQRDGEEVLLCWRLGEEEIGFWHGLEEGFSGRRPLPL